MNKLDEILGTITTCVLLPAYGDRYNSPEEAISAWEQGSDFKIAGGGPYVSIRNELNLLEDYDSIIIKYIGEVKVK